MDNEELKDEIFILLDTCTFSNFINKNLTKNVKEFFYKIFKCDTRPCISDLSLIELINGCRDIKELKHLTTNLNDCEFLIYGHIDSVKKLIQDSIVDNIVNVDDLKQLKEDLLDIKIEYLKDIFYSILCNYCILYYALMEFYDPDFWQGSFYYFTKIISSKETKELIEELFTRLTKEELEVKDILFETANSIAYGLICRVKNKKLDKNIVTEHVEKNDVQNRLSKLTKKLVEFIKTKYKNEVKDVKNKDNQLLFLMEYLKNHKLIDDNNFENELLSDSINYVVMNSGFCKGKFHINHLVDLYNVSLVGGDYKFYYITDDEFWNKFVSTEKKINPRLNNRITYINKKFYEFQL